MDYITISFHQLIIKSIIINIHWLFSLFVDVIYFEKAIQARGKYANVRSRQYILFIIICILRSPCNSDRKWRTYDYQENEVYPVPEGVGVLYVIHYVRPSFQANYLQIDISNCALLCYDEIAMNKHNFI